MKTLWKKLVWRYVSGRGMATAEIIKKWRPEDISSEKAIEESLYGHLVRNLEGLSIRRQFRYDRITADILIEDEVAIEIKLNLTGTREFHRLIGQIETYAKWGKDLVIVLVGEVDLDIKDRIEDRLRTDWDESFEGERAQVIHIPANGAM
jgi:hypothetical protein